MINKTFEIQKEDGWIVVNTGTVDRDRDRVLPSGADLSNYLKNPLVLWGHDYRSPWAIIGRAAEIRTEGDIRIRPELREPASDTDPMHIIRSLWDANLVRAASIGFNPLTWAENELGGRDFTEWELLEVSIVPVPANQEALRLAVKGLSEGEPPTASAPEYVTTSTDVAGGPEPVQRPYPNEHACRLREPSAFQPDSLRRVNREHEGKRYSVIMGKLTGQDTMIEQAYRYPKDTWDADEARAHCRAHDGQSFEPASDGKAEQPDEQRDAEPTIDAPPAGELTPEELDALLAGIDEYLVNLRQQLEV